MSIPVMTRCRTLQLPPTVKAVLMAIAWHADDTGGAYPSLVTLGIYTCLGKTAIISAISWLEDNRLLEIKRGGSTRGGTKVSNRYSIVLERLDVELFGEKPQRPTGPARETDRSGGDDGAENGVDQSADRTGFEGDSSGDQFAGNTGQAGEPVRQADRLEGANEANQFVSQTGTQGEPVRLAAATGSSGEPDRSVWRSKPVREADPNSQEQSVTVIESSSACASDDEPRLTDQEIARELLGIPTVPAGLDREVLARFFRHRRALRRPITISGWLALQPRFRELAAGHHDLNESLRQTMEAGLSLPVTPTTKGNNHATHRESASDRTRRFAEDGERRDAAAALAAGGALEQHRYPDVVGSDG